MSESTSTTKRRVFVGGNWKSNGSRSIVSSLLSSLSSLSVPSITDVCVCPPFIYLDKVNQILSDKTDHPILVCSQNVSPYKNGAYTGEISAEQLVDLGIRYTLIGHSERRQLFHTSDEIIRQQINRSREQHMSIIYCIGETEQQRKENETEKVIYHQLSVLQAVISQPSDWNTSTIIIAYEPVWAIGTGQTATAEQAQQAHHWIREWLSTHVSPSVASSTLLIYGGSVSSKNAKELIIEVDIDGFLVGGASLKAEDFAQIVAATASKAH